MRRMSRSRKKKFSNLPENSHLPPELLTDILSKLPAKTLLKFRCVCKVWCCLIDSPVFISLHLKHYNHPKNNPILLTAKTPSRVEFTVHRKDTFRKILDLITISKSSAPDSYESIRYSIIGSCNGLFLIFFINMNNIVLWNPSIRKLLIVPPCPSYVGRISYKCVLGFALPSNDYKVLAYQYNRLNSSDKMLIAVYSVNGNLWKIIKPDLPNVWVRHLLYMDNQLSLCGGALYWLVYDPQQSEIVKRSHLLSFDFEVEDFTIMQLPDIAQEHTVKFVFTLGESLALFAITSESIYIWKMEKGGGEDPWRLWFLGDSNRDAFNLFEPIITQYPFPRILYCEKSKGFLVVQRRGRGNLGRVMSYNITTHRIKDMRKNIHGEVSLDTFLESLVLHKRFTGQTLLSFP